MVKRNKHVLHSFIKEEWSIERHINSKLTTDGNLVGIFFKCVGIYKGKKSNLSKLYKNGNGGWYL